MFEITKKPEPAEDAAEAQWRMAFLAGVRAQQEYDRLLSDPMAADAEIDRVWLCLYRAQQAQAELLRAA